MKKTIIFPYSKNDFGFCLEYTRRNFDTIIASFMGTSFIGKDLGYSVNRGKIGILIKDIYDVKDIADEIIILDNKLSQQNVNLLKEIVLNLSPHIKVSSYINLNVNVDNYSYLKVNDFPKFKDLGYYYPNIPIVFVNNLVPSDDSELIVFQLKNILMRKGIKVASLMKRCNCKVLDSWIIPESFYNRKYPPEQAIFMLNQYIRKIIESDLPEILIIELNDGLLRYNDEIMNSFGVYNYMIYESVNPDYNIINLPIQHLEENFISELNNYFQRKYESPIDAIHVSNALKVNSGDFTYDFIDITLRIPSNEIAEEVEKLKSDTKIGDFENESYIELIVDEMFKRWS